MYSKFFALFSIRKLPYFMTLPLVAMFSLLVSIRATAIPVEWGSLSDLTYNAAIYPDGASATYVAASINFKDLNGNVITNNPRFTLVYFAYQPEGLGIAGGLEGSGRSASGWFNQRGQYDFGMNPGQTANQTEGNVDNGYWRMFVDINGNGKYGTYDSSTGFFNFEEWEEIASVRVANFQGFQTGVGTLSAGDISGVYLPASVGLLTSLSILSFTLENESSNVIAQFDVQAVGTDITACSFALLTKTNLSQSSWTTNASYAVTGSVTRIAATNVAENLFFMVAD